MPKKFYRSKRRFRRRTYKKRTTRKVTKPVRRYVRRAFKAMAEKKQAVVQYTASGVTNTDVTTQPLALALFPNIYQGVERCDRVGNRVNVASNVFKFRLSRMSVTGASAVPLLTTMIIARLKNTFNAPGLSDFNQLLYSDTSTVGAVGKIGLYSASVQGLMLPYNRDIWDIKYTRTFKLWNSTPASSASNYYSNNDFSLTANGTLNCAKWMKKKWAFNNTTNNQPENDGLYAFFFVNTLDSTAGPTNAIFVDAVLTTTFTDA